MEDGALLDLYFSRDQRAIPATEKKYGPYCRRVAQNILARNEDAEECLNDTWLRAWEAIPPQRPARLALFLGKITRNLALNRFASERAEKRGGGAALALEELSECVPAPQSVELEVEAEELTRMLNGFLRSQPERPRNLFLRRYWFADSLAEIGARYHMSEGAVKASLFRTRQKLRAYLEQEGITL